MENDILNKTTDTISQVTKKTKTGIKNYITIITILVLLLFTIAISLGELQFKDGTSLEFWINLVYLVLISVVSLCVMLPLGADNEKKMLAGYYENRKTWASKTGYIVNNGKSTSFNDYCKEFTNKLRKEKRESYVLEASISLNDYYNFFAKMTPKELRKYYIHCKKERKEVEKYDYKPVEREEQASLINNTIPLSLAQYRLLKRTKKAIRVKPIIPTRILNASHNKHEYSIGQSQTPFVAKILSIRIIGIIVYSLILATIVVVPTGETGLSVFIAIIIRLFGVITSAVMGYASGRQMTRNDNTDTLDRIAFISGFLEQYKVNHVQQETQESKEAKSTQNTQKEFQPQYMPLMIIDNKEIQ